MSETVSVNLSGPALAFLLYENVKSRHEQEGFLLGDTNVIVTKTITDTDSQNTKSHKVINIDAVVPCLKTGLFYNNTGTVDINKLENILGSDISNVVAWFRYEPETKFQFSVRGKLVHKELSKCGLFSIPSELFSCCLLTSMTTQFESTYAYSHMFLRYKNNFMTVPLHINNLGESYNSYKPNVRISKLFTELCKPKIFKTGDFNFRIIDEIQDKLHSETGKIIKDLAKSERDKAILEKDFDQIAKQIEYYESILREKQIVEAKAQKHVDNLETQLTDFNVNHLSENESKIEESVISKEQDLKSDLAVRKTSNTNKHMNKKNKTEKSTKSQKTEDKEDLLHTSSDTSIDNNSFSENLIDLTMDEDEIKLSTPKMSYAQIATSTKGKKNSL